jgi:hypothetical protein
VFRGFSKNLCFIYELNFAFPFAEFIKEEMTCLLPEVVRGARLTRQKLTLPPTHPTSTTAHLRGDYFMTRGNSPFVRSFSPSPQEHPYSSLIRELLVWVLVPTSHFENLPAGSTVRPFVTNCCPTDAVRDLEVTAPPEYLKAKIKV